MSFREFPKFNFDILCDALLVNSNSFNENTLA